jgi:hypothetical protein
LFRRQRAPRVVDHGERGVRVVIEQVDRSGKPTVESSRPAMIDAGPS